MRRLFAACLFCLVSSLASAESIYVSQSGAGDGSSCSSPRSASWFNTSGNWANPKVSGKIGPGDTVYLCSTITSALTLQNSGSSGSYVTIDGSGATMGTSARFLTNEKSWWKIQNCTWADAAAVEILNVSGGSNGIFTGAYSDNNSNDPLIWIAQPNGVLPNTITISNSYLRTGAIDYGNTQHDIIKTEGSTNVILEGNYLEMRAGGEGSSAHDDVIQTYESGSAGSGGPPTNWTIRYNWIVMNSVVTSNRSWTMLENLGGSNYIYGNVFLGIQGADGANGLCINSSQAGVLFYVYNNTFVAKGTASNNVLNVANSGTLYLSNNVFHLQNQTGLTGGMTISRSYNLWYGTSIPSCSGITGELCAQDPLFTNYTSNVFTLTGSSPAKGSGTNLGAGPAGQTFDYGLANASTWPTPTLVSRGTTWDRGGYQTAAASAPAAPTNVRIR